MKVLGLALILTIAACGKESDGTQSPSSTRSPASLGAAQKPASVGAVPQAGSAVGTRTIDLRLRGVAAPGPVRVSPSAVEVTVDGRPVEAQVISTEVNLGDENQAWRIATFSLPDAGKAIAVSITLAPDGTVERNGKTEIVDLRGAPIAFRADAGQSRTENKIAVDIDLTRSIVSEGGSSVFMPDFLVRY